MISKNNETKINVSEEKINVFEEKIKVEEIHGIIKLDYKNNNLN